MITVISGTNRPDNLCKVFAKTYFAFLQQHSSEPVQLLALDEIGEEWATAAMYGKDSVHPSLIAIQDQFVLPVQKFVIISPEYNGSFPGILKLFIDACSIREYPRNFKGKHAALVGVASGRAGNLRGMEHLTGLFNYLGMHIMPNKLPISSIKTLMNTALDTVTEQATLHTMEQHAKEFLAYVGALAKEPVAVK